MHDSIICGCAPLMGNTVSDRLHYAHLTRTHFDVEVVTFVSDLENFRPRKTINPQLVAIDQQTSGAHTNHNLHAVLVLTKYHIKVNKQDAIVCSGARTNLKVGAREKFCCPPLFLSPQVKSVVLVSTFVMVSTVWSVSSLLFHSRCSPCLAICKSGKHVPHCLWSARHRLYGLQR